MFKHIDSKAFFDFYEKSKVRFPVFFVIFISQFFLEAQAGTIKTCDQYSAKILNDKASPFAEIIQKAADDHDVSAGLIKAVITAESCFRQHARSGKGALGLMQLMPATAKRFGAEDRSNPEQNIDAGARYLKYLLKRYQGSIVHAVAAYNAGENRIKPGASFRVPYRETRLYVGRVLNALSKLETEKQGREHARTLLVEWVNGRKILSVPAQKKPPVADKQEQQEQPKLLLAALQKFTDSSVMMDVEPGLLEPPETSIRLSSHNKIPAAKKVSPAAAKADDQQVWRDCRKAPAHLMRHTRLQGSGRYGAFFYKARAGENLPQMADKLGVSLQTVLQLNNFREGEIPAPGQMLRVAECVRTSG